MPKLPIPDFEWPTCPDCGRPVVVTRGGDFDGPQTWFTFCCWDGPDRDDPLSALRAFVEKVGKEGAPT